MCNVEYSIYRETTLGEKILRKYAPVFIFYNIFVLYKPICSAMNVDDTLFELESGSAAPTH